MKTADKKLTVVHANGFPITVTDLPAAINQTGAYKTYAHRKPSQEQQVTDKERQAYWSDLHNKLLKLGDKQPTT